MQAMNVKIDRDRDGWYYADAEDHEINSARRATYDEIKATAISDGRKIENGGWKRKLLMWNWQEHMLDGFPGWELDGRAPSFAALSHVRGEGPTQSSVLAEAWDDAAEVDFYSRESGTDGTWMCGVGETFHSFWWFRTFTERDRFLAWAIERGETPSAMP